MSNISAEPTLSRRNFLRGRIQLVIVPPRPPGAVDEARFLTACTRCDDCLRACEERILIRGDGGFPEVDLGRGGCTFCGDCARACKAGLIEERAQSWGYRAAITDRCLSANGVLCRSCGDACATGAIRFRPAPRGIAIPAIDSTRCNGCGSCFAPCPIGAVEVRDQTGQSPISQLRNLSG